MLEFQLCDFVMVVYNIDETFNTCSIDSSAYLFYVWFAGLGLGLKRAGLALSLDLGTAGLGLGLGIEGVGLGLGLCLVTAGLEYNTAEVWNVNILYLWY